MGWSQLCCQMWYQLTRKIMITRSPSSGGIRFFASMSSPWDSVAVHHGEAFVPGVRVFGRISRGIFFGFGIGFRFRLRFRPRSRLRFRFSDI